MSSNLYFRYKSTCHWDLKNRNLRENCFRLHLCMLNLELLEPVSGQGKVKNLCFVINHHLRYEFSHGCSSSRERSSVPAPTMSSITISIIIGIIVSIIISTMISIIIIDMTVKTLIVNISSMSLIRTSSMNDTQ